MKVQCNQCGKMFKVPDSQAHRSLKCVCKNIFLAVPLPEEIVEDKTEERRPTTPARSESSTIFQRTASFDPNSDIPVESEETEEGLKEYVSFLKNSRSQNQNRDEESTARASNTTLKTFELANTIESKTSSDSNDLIAELMNSPSDIPASSPTVEASSSTAKPTDRSAIERGGTKERTTTPRVTTKPPIKAPRKENRRAVILAVVGVISIIVVTIAVNLPQKPIEESVDPVLTQLLTPHTPEPGRQIKIAPPPDRKIYIQKSTEASKPAPVEVVEPLLGNQESKLYQQMRTDLIAGEFENVIRVGSSAPQLQDEEAALFLEALFERAGEKFSRHQELVKKLEDYRTHYPSSSALVRTMALALIKNSEKEKSIAKAIEILKSLQLTRAEDPLVFAYLGRAYDLIDRSDLAHRAWDQSLALDPHFVSILRTREESYRSERKYNAALDMATKLSGVPGHEVEGLTRMAQVLELKNDTANALHHYRKAIKIEDSSALRIAMADILLEGNREGGIRELEAALKAHPSKIEKRDINVRLGRIYCDAKTYEAATQAFRRAIAEDARSIKIVQEKARCELRAKSFRTAASTLENGLKLSPNNPQIWHDYGYSLLHQDKLKPALEAAKRSLELKPSDQNFVLVAQVLVAMKKKPEAAIYLKKAIQANPKNREARSLLQQVN